MKREPLFEGWWTDTATGARLERATRQQLREATGGGLNTTLKFPSDNDEAGDDI